MSLHKQREACIPLTSKKEASKPISQDNLENSSARSNNGAGNEAPLSESKTRAHEDTNEGLEQFKQLGSYMQGVQRAIGGAYQKMSDSLMASTSMLYRMNGMMEQYVCRSLTVAVTTETETETVTVTATTTTTTPEGDSLEQEKGIYLVVKVTNLTEIPLASVQVQVAPSLAQTTASSTVTDAIEQTEAPAQTETLAETETKSEAALSQAEPKIVDVLEAQGEAVFRFESSADCLRYYALHGVKIVVSLPSPGTERRLETASVHPVYYSNLCRVERRQCVNREDLTFRKEITNVCASDLRRYLQLSPFDSLCVTHEKEDPIHAVYDKLAEAFVAYIDIVQVNPADETCTVVLMAVDEEYLRFFQQELVLFLKQSQKG